MTKTLDHQIVERAYHLIEDEKNWCQGTHARGGNGGWCYPHDDCAVRFCAYGAIRRATFEMTGKNPDYWEVGGGAAQRLENASFDLYGLHLVATNDSIGHAAVMRVFQRTLQKMRQ